MKVQINKQEDSAVWKEANALAEYIYSILDKIPQEDWSVASKLRISSTDMIFYCSQAINNTNPSGQEFDWGYTRKAVGTSKTLYRFVGRQKLIKLDPEIMVRFDRLIDLIDIEVQKAYDQTAAQSEKELDVWRKKHKLSKEVKGS